ncbi:hypothetical protein EYF80_009434 [Liparis tanakae]|uniref:Uncharacterized protein n=1 Tax=Liparis tanakae TaxID=230148 RepID=A0A4Z2IQX9_9TELE|nr:hypothetical protein EYF80_009434 [Liparis tanakae]
MRKPRVSVELSVSLHCMYLGLRTPCWALSCSVGAPGSTATILSYMSFRSRGRSLALLSSSSKVLPAAHFTVHDGGRVKVSQQVIHQVIILLLSLYYPIITRHIGAQRVLHQLLEALLLTLAVSLQQAAELPRLEVTWEKQTEPDGAVVEEEAGADGRTHHYGEASGTKPAHQPRGQRHQGWEPETLLKSEPTLRANAPSYSRDAAPVAGNPPVETDPGETSTPL